jgi:hypothetical protein
VTTPPLADCGPRAPQPAPRVSLPRFYLSGSSDGSTGALTAPGTPSLHGRCATDRRRGTDLLAGHRRARRVKAGVRTPVSGERAVGGLRAGPVPGCGEATPAHAPARPLSVNGRRRGGTASTRPASTVLHPRAESADTKLTARPARECDPGPAARSAASPGNLPPALVFGPGTRRASACAGTSTVHARKGNVRMTSPVSQRSTRQSPRTVTRQVTRLSRPADATADSGRVVVPGQRLNIPAGVNRG